MLEPKQFKPEPNSFKPENGENPLFLKKSAEKLTAACRAIAERRWDARGRGRDVP
jgi:hypothetical protein